MIKYVQMLLIEEQRTIFSNLECMIIVLFYALMISRRILSCVYEIRNLRYCALLYKLTRHHDVGYTNEIKPDNLVLVITVFGLK